VLVLSIQIVSWKVLGIEPNGEEVNTTNGEEESDANCHDDKADEVVNDGWSFAHGYSWERIATIFGFFAFGCLFRAIKRCILPSAIM